MWSVLPVLLCAVSLAAGRQWLCGGWRHVASLGNTWLSLTDCRQWCVCRCRQLPWQQVRSAGDWVAG